MENKERREQDNREHDLIISGISDFKREFIRTSEKQSQELKDASRLGSESRKSIYEKVEILSEVVSAMKEKEKSNDKKIEKLEVKVEKIEIKSAGMGAIAGILVACVPAVLKFFKN